MATPSRIPCRLVPLTFGGGFLTSIPASTTIPPLELKPRPTDHFGSAGFLFSEGSSGSSRGTAPTSGKELSYRSGNPEKNGISGRLCWRKCLLKLSSRGSKCRAKILCSAALVSRAAKARFPFLLSLHPGRPTSGAFFRCDPLTGQLSEWRRRFARLPRTSSL